MKQKAEITFEIEETTVVRRFAPELTAVCPLCRTMVEMITPCAAAALLGCGEREIFRLIESAEIHFVEAGRVFICRDSLTNRLVPSANDIFMD